jgi:hypothetical protein
MIKSGFLRRSSQIVKHSRFLRNLKVLPMFPEVADDVPDMEGTYQMDGNLEEMDEEEEEEQ